MNAKIVNIAGVTASRSGIMVQFYELRVGSPGSKLVGSHRVARTLANTSSGNGPPLWMVQALELLRTLPDANWQEVSCSHYYGCRKWSLT